MADDDDSTVVTVTGDPSEGEDVVAVGQGDTVEESEQDARDNPDFEFDDDDSGGGGGSSGGSSTSSSSSGSQSSGSSNDDSSTVIVSGDPGSEEGQTVVGTGDTEEEAQVDAATNPRFDAAEGSEIDSVEDRLGSDGQADSDSTSVVVTGGAGSGEPQQVVGQGDTTLEARRDAASNPRFDAAQGEPVDALESAQGQGQGDGTSAGALIQDRRGNTGRQETTVSKKREKQAKKDMQALGGVTTPQGAKLVRPSGQPVTSLGGVTTPQGNRVSTGANEIISNVDRVIDQVNTVNQQNENLNRELTEEQKEFRDAANPETPIIDNFTAIPEEIGRQSAQVLSGEQNPREGFRQVEEEFQIQGLGIVSQGQQFGESVQQKLTEQEVDPNLPVTEDIQNAAQFAEEFGITQAEEVADATERFEREVVGGAATGGTAAGGIAVAAPGALSENLRGTLQNAGVDAFEGEDATGFGEAIVGGAQQTSEELTGSPVEFTGSEIGEETAETLGGFVLGGTAGAAAGAAPTITPEVTPETSITQADVLTPSEFKARTNEVLFNSRKGSARPVSPSRERPSPSTREKDRSRTDPRNQAPERTRTGEDRMQELRDFAQSDPRSNQGFSSDVRGEFDVENVIQSQNKAPARVDTSTQVEDTTATGFDFTTDTVPTIQSEDDVLNDSQVNADTLSNVESVPESITEPRTEPETTPETVPETVPEVFAEPERPLEPRLEITPETTPETVPEPTPEPDPDEDEINDVFNPIVEDPGATEDPSAAPSVDAILFGQTTEENVEDETVFTGFETREVEENNNDDLDAFF